MENSISRRKSGRWTQHLASWMIMLPSIILFAFFIWGPLIQSVQMSFFTTKNISLERFVWLNNYISIFKSPDFWQAFRNTLMYTVWSLLIGFLIPIIMALVIGETVRAKGFFRTASYIPNILPGLAAIILYTAFFSAERTGVFNIILSWFGVEPQAFLSKSNLVIPLIVIISTWKGAGATALIYMAGLAGVNPELYEAATIDGAGIWKRLRHITLPAIFNLGSTMLILQIIAIFQILYEPMVLTKGGPDNASLSIMQLMWRYAFGGRMEYGKAAATGVIISVILLVFTALYRFVNKRKTDWEG